MERGVKPADLQLLRLTPRQSRGDGARHICQRALRTKWWTSRRIHQAPPAARNEHFRSLGKYTAEGVPLVILAGKEYGSGSSRDWAAKGPRLLGVFPVIEESYRAHPPPRTWWAWCSPACQLHWRENAEVSRLTGDEFFRIKGIREADRKFSSDNRWCEGRFKWKCQTFKALVRIDTPQEALYYANGGF